MDITPLALPDIQLISFKRHLDQRGWFSELFNEDALKNLGVSFSIKQNNLSHSQQGVIRGLHMQRAPFGQAKLVYVLSGEILDVIVDARPHSKTFGQHMALSLSETRSEAVYIPAGFLHGFSTLSPEATLFYSVDAFYQPSAELTVQYNDRFFNIDWKIPLDQQLISPKDNNALSFSDLAKLL